MGPEEIPERDAWALDIWTLDKASASFLGERFYRTDVLLRVASQPCWESIDSSETIELVTPWEQKVLIPVQR